MIGSLFKDSHAKAPSRKGQKQLDIFGDFATWRESAFSFDHVHQIGSTVFGRSKRLCYLLVLSLLAPPVATAAVPSADPVKVLNVRFEIAGTKIVVRYDLQGEADKDYTVKVILRREGSQSFAHIPKSLAGEVGEGRFVGRDRQITWDILKEFPQGLEGDDYYFVIEVEIISKGISPLWYIGGGLGVIGGVVGYVLMKGGTEAASSPAVEAFPKPVGRPAGN